MSSELELGSRSGPVERPTSVSRDNNYFSISHTAGPCQTPRRLPGRAAGHTASRVGQGGGDGG